MKWLSFLALTLLLGCSVSVPIKLHEPANYSLPKAKLRAT